MLSCAFPPFLSSLFISVYSLRPHLSQSFIWGHPSPLYIPFTRHCPSFTLFTSPHSFLPPSASLCHLLARSLSQGSTNSNMLDVQGGAHKKRVRRSSLLNAKKLYEDAQMARKVKQYLSNLTVETDEEKHQIMSLQCEPSYSTCEWHRNWLLIWLYRLVCRCYICIIGLHCHLVLQVYMSCWKEQE